MGWTVTSPSGQVAISLDLASGVLRYRRPPSRRQGRRRLAAGIADP